MTVVKIDTAMISNSAAFDICVQLGNVHVAAHMHLTTYQKTFMPYWYAGLYSHYNFMWYLLPYHYLAAPLLCHLVWEAALPKASVPLSTLHKFSNIYDKPTRQEGKRCKRVD